MHVGSSASASDTERHFIVFEIQEKNPNILKTHSLFETIRVNATMQLRELNSTECSTPPRRDRMHKL